MSYEVVVGPAACRDLDALPDKVYRRVDKHIVALGETPRPRGSKKLAGTEDGYRVRVGSYRILYRVDDKAAIVEITRVGHRRDVYR